MPHSFRRNNKAVSTIFGMVFFLLIVVIVFASFAIVLNQSTSLEATMIQSRQIDNEKASEHLTITPQIGSTNPLVYSAIYYFGVNSVTIKCNITNIASIPIQLTRLWVQDITTQTANASVVSTIIQPGQSIPNYSGTVAVPGVTQVNTDQFRFWFVTGRGNQFSLSPMGATGATGSTGPSGSPGPSGAPGSTGSPGPSGAPGPSGIPGRNGVDGVSLSSLVAQGIGSIEMNFSTFRVYSVTGNSSPWTATGYNRNGMGGSPGYATSSGTNIAFSVNITNRDPYQRGITLRSNSVFWVIFPTQPQQVRCAYWYIVNVNSNNGQITNAAFTNIPIAVNQTITVTFASSQDTGTINNFGKQSSGYSGPAAAFLMLSGTFNTGDPFGQNLPFVTVAFS